MSDSSPTTHISNCAIIGEPNGSFAPDAANGSVIKNCIVVGDSVDGSAFASVACADDVEGAIDAVHAPDGFQAASEVASQEPPGVRDSTVAESDLTPGILEGNILEGAVRIGVPVQDDAASLKGHIAESSHSLSPAGLDNRRMTGSGGGSNPAAVEGSVQNGPSE